jgi:hypothetical protein
MLRTMLRVVNCRRAKGPMPKQCRRNLLYYRQQAQVEDTRQSRLTTWHWYSLVVSPRPVGQLISLQIQGVPTLFVASFRARHFGIRRQNAPISGWASEAAHDGEPLPD